MNWLAFLDTVSGGFRSIVYDTVSKTILSVTMSELADISLFDRVPGDVLRPLSGPNRRRMWALLVDLYQEFFGPDAMLAPEHGFTHREITQAVERYLISHPGWEEEGIDPLTPLIVRANGILDKLLDTGWLKIYRLGVRNFISMGQEVGKFLEHLIQYADEGPADIGGSILMIHNTLKEAGRDPEGQAPAFRRAAKEARELIGTLTHTHVRVREVMASLSAETTTAGYVRSFFEQYITGIFIRDYRELRTTNHPLRYRHDILRILSDLRDDPDNRAKLEAGYLKLFEGDAQAVDRAMSRDFERIRRFEDVEIYLDRLDGSVTRAARQALSYITYHLRTRDRLDRLLQQAADAVRDSASELAQTPWGSGGLFCEAMLREPVKRRPPAPREVIRKRQITLEERARWNLEKLMVRHREVTPAAVVAYLNRQLDGRSSISSDALKVESIQELVLLTALARVAHHRQHMGPFGADTTLGRGLRHYRITLDSDAVTENEFIVLPRFLVQVESSR